MLTTAMNRPSLLGAAIRRAWRPSLLQSAVVGVGGAGPQHVNVGRCTPQQHQLQPRRYSQSQPPPEPIRPQRPLGNKRRKGRYKPRKGPPKPKPIKVDINWDPLPAPIRKGSKKQQESPKKSKPRSPPGRYKGEVIHKQSKHSTRDLFDAIAPHVEMKTLHRLTAYIIGKRINQLRLRGKGKGDRWRALNKSLNVAFDASGKEAKDFHFSVKRHPWMQELVEDFFMGLPPKSPKLGFYKLGHIDDKNDTSDGKQRHVTILAKAREVAAKHPIFWTKAMQKEGGYTPTGLGGRGKAMEEKRAEHRERMSERVAELHNPKKKEKVQSEAKDMLAVLLEKLPLSHFEALMERLEGYAALWSKKTKASRVESPNADKNNITILGDALGAVSPSHSHLIAIDLALYLYVDLPTTDVEEGETARQAAAAAIDAHGLLRTAQRQYKRERDRFVERALRAQLKFASLETEDDDVEAIAASFDGKDAEGGAEKRPEGEGVESVWADLEGTALEKLKEEEKEEVAQTLGGLQRTGAEREKGGGRPRNRMHLRYTAIQLDSAPHPSESETEERLVFLENLPIDTTEEEIDQVYSRCGPLDSIRLFNLRPDLDPGPLSKKQMEERRRKTRLNNRDAFKPYEAARRERPRTPVYGMIRFQTMGGYKVATCPDLTIFGINIRRHPVLSIKPEERTTLYLEQIRSGLYDSDVEQRLATFFAAHQFGVMRDGMAHPTTRAKEITCEIKFEDFHAAQRAYDLLRSKSCSGEDNAVPLLGSELFDEDYDDEWLEKRRDSDEVHEECKVHWYRTPEKSMQYWTRELGPL